ncbi:helix-turn-helix domain-containing protein [Microbacteriaceae bacterium VKM Ac-2854]|nr:helix-turn-helix domain-containing protein [Microbacteriaceae bacterium VKM Ac-2854]
MAIAMHHSRSRNSTDIAVLVGIANHDGDGGAWPTVPTLAHYARVSDRQVQRSLTELIRLGEIVRDIQHGGTAEIAHYDRPNLYHFVLKCPPHCDGSRGHKLLCRKCGKAMPKSFQTRFFHPECEPAAAPEVALDPVTPTSPGDAQSADSDPVTSASPGDTHVTGPVSPASPKTPLELSTYVDKETYVPNDVRARERTEGQGRKSEPLRGASSGAVFDVAGSLRDAADALSASNALCKAFPQRRGIRCQYAPINGRCVHCGERSRDEMVFDGIAYNAQGEVL